MPKPAARLTYLVLLRHTMDDLPIFTTTSKRLAMRRAQQTDTGTAEEEHAKSVMGIDCGTPVNVSVVMFRNGNPVRMQIVKDLAA